MTRGCEAPPPPHTELVLPTDVHNCTYSPAKNNHNGL